MAKYTVNIQFRQSWMGRKNRWVAFVSFWDMDHFAPYSHCDFPSEKTAKRFALGYTG